MIKQLRAQIEADKANLEHIDFLKKEVERLKKLLEGEEK